MKINGIFKNFTDGLAVFLAVLIAVYIMTGYIKTDSGKNASLSMTEKIEKLITTQSYRIYINIFLLLVLSAVVGILIRRLPSLGVVASALPLAYELFLLTQKLLTKYPTAVILFTAAHAVGALLYAEVSDRSGRTRLARPLGAAIVGTLGAAFSAYTAVLCERVLTSADAVAELKTHGLVPGVAVQTIRGAIDRIYAVYLTEGTSTARTLGSEYLKSLGESGVCAAFRRTVEGDHISAYLGVAVLLFGAAILGIYLSSKKLWWARSLISCIPCAVIAVLLIGESIGAGGIVLLLAALYLIV